MRPTFVASTLLCLLGYALAGCSDDNDPRALGAPGVALDAGSSDSSAAGEPFACDIVAPTACPSPAPKYADVQPIFTKQCGMCHGRDWTGEWPLDNYSHIADWRDEVRSELVTCSMPPPDSGVRIPLSERMTILNWIKCGLPR